jgi:hypothetical protein
MGKCSEKKNYISAETVGWCLIGTLVGCIVFNVVTYSINKYRLEEAVATLTREQIRQDAKIEALKMFIIDNTEDKK